ncbi:hypothetical protein EDD85DRAFT_861375 [Armillaria nabsnona]|nr:hypothetical protein EDD85DRAFT_861375 [Armillaria nabsnona]
MFRGSSYLANDWPLIPLLPEKADETKRYIAQNIQQVTEENVRYIRSYHPAFEDADLVFVYCNPSSLRESVWIVHPAFARSNAFLLENLFVAGREVHPFEHVPPETSQLALLSGYYRPIDDPLVRTTLNPRVPLSNDDISIIRKQWPSIIGVRMYVCGAIGLLLHPWEDIGKVKITAGWSTGIGGLRAQIEWVQNYEPFVNRTPCALKNGTRNSGTNQIGSTGLRIRGRFGEDKNIVSDAIITNTHSFIHTPRGMSMHSSLKGVPVQQILFDITHDIFLMIKFHIASTQTCRAVCSWPSVSWALTRLVGSTSPLGKEVYAGGQKVGKISKCYDSPSLAFIYPFGYRHDLSLITDVALPVPTLPPGLPIITGFEPTFDAVLRPGCPLFVASYCLEDMVPVQVLGTQYTWEPNSEAGDVSRCLLWRSSNENDTMGSVLCLGSPGAHETRVVAFQNFEVDMLHQQGAVPLAKDQRRFLRYKGGFALPKEVLESQVVMPQPEA